MRCSATSRSPARPRHPARRRRATGSSWPPRPRPGRSSPATSGADAARLSPAALETLAIVAYRQPVTRGVIERIRGVDSDYVVRALLHRRLVVEQGRAETPGRPILYGTELRVPGALRADLARRPAAARRGGRGAAGRGGGRIEPSQDGEADPDDGDRWASRQRSTRDAVGRPGLMAPSASRRCSPTPASPRAGRPKRWSPPDASPSTGEPRRSASGSSPASTGSRSTGGPIGERPRAGPPGRAQAGGRHLHRRATGTPSATVLDLVPATLRRARAGSTRSAGSTATRRACSC